MRAFRSSLATIPWLVIGVRPNVIVKTPRSDQQPAGQCDLIVHARYYRSGVQLGMHAHREAQLLFAGSGVMQVTTPAGRWLVPPARAVWLPARLDHAVDVLADIEMRTIYLAPGWVAAHAEAQRLGREFVVEVSPLLRELILGAFGSGFDYRRLALLAELALCELVEARDAATFMPLPVEPRARRVADMVLSEPANERDLAELAEASGASARTITRLFPAETGLTFKTWRQRARVMSGVTALGVGRSSIKQVAARLGFSSVAAFSHAVREVTGRTPSEFLSPRSGMLEPSKTQAD